MADPDPLPVRTVEIELWEFVSRFILFVLVRAHFAYTLTP